MTTPNLKHSWPSMTWRASPGFRWRPCGGGAFFGRAQSTWKLAAVRYKP